jgi:hypothetical protein
VRPIFKKFAAPEYAVTIFGITVGFETVQDKGLSCTPRSINKKVLWEMNIIDVL